jgi:hypothetical protein
MTKHIESCQGKGRASADPVALSKPDAFLYAVSQVRYTFSTSHSLLIHTLTLAPLECPVIV